MRGCVDIIKIVYLKTVHESVDLDWTVSGLVPRFYKQNEESSAGCTKYTEFHDKLC